MIINENKAPLSLVRVLSEARLYQLLSMASVENADMSQLDLVGSV